MKKVIASYFLISLFPYFLSAQSLNMRNRSAWKSSSETAAVTGVQQVAEEDTSSVKRLAEFVVTASRTEKKLDDVGRSVSVISSEDIKNSGANSLAELLNLAEGIYVTGAQQNFGSNQSIFIRGANSNQSVVMLD